MALLEQIDSPLDLKRLQEEGRLVPVTCLAVRDRFVPHGLPEGLLAELGLDASGIARAALRLCGRQSLRVERPA